MKQAPIRLLLTITGVVGLLFSLYTQAATITVNAPDGTIADDGLCSISEAIMAANTDDVVSVMAGECPAGSGDDEIELTTDINLLTTIDTTIDNTGTPAITSKLSINGNGLTIQRDQNLSCNLTGAATPLHFRVLLVARGGELNLHDVSLKNGCIRNENGAAIYNKGTINSIDNVSFQSNHADHAGGAIYLASGSRIDAITHSEFLQNFSQYLGGGAIHMESADITLIENSLFDANTTQASTQVGQGGGGALSVNNSSIETLRNSTFSENMATNGSGGHGGAIFIFRSVITLLENSTFSKNSANWRGGAIYAYYDGSMTLNNATFYQNTAGQADAIGMILDTVNSSNNLFVGHDQDCYIRNSGSTSISSNNLSTLTNGGCKGVLATTLTAATIGELADNGGPTTTHALLAGSEALDSAIAGTSTDQRGFAAFQTRDIGAYELQGIELCPLDLKTDGFTTTVSDADELNQAIECANFNGEANGGDTINLGADINLTTTIDTTIGNTGTPAITSKLSINGNGLTIQRDQNLSCNLYGAPTRLHFRILLVARGGELNLHDVSLKNGCIRYGYGAAIYNKGTINSIDNVSFQSNHAANGGGAIYLASGSRIDAITDSEFLQNFSRNGSGAIQMKSADITLIENSLFDANTSNASYSNGQGGGGALYMRDSSIGNLRNSTFSENMAAPSVGDGHGGAIFIEDSVITLLENSTFSKNSASRFGGAIFVFYDGSVTLKNATFYQNTAGRADAIYIYEEEGFNSSNNLFVGHDQDCYIFRPDSTSINNNNLSTLTNGGCKGVLATTLTAATIGELADNGGPTMTHALLAGSEALDSAIAGTSTDQRGFAAFDIRDIGAFETHVPSIVAPADFTSEATGPLSSPDLGLASVADVDEEGLVGIANPENNFAVGMTTVTWTVTDSQAFSDTDTQIVTIVDTTPPTVTAPVAIVVEASGPSTAVNLGTATATDLVDGSVTPSADMSSPFAVGVHTVTWSATDAALNTGTALQTTTVEDTTAPVLSLIGTDPVNLTAGTTYTDAGATATDLVDDDIALTANIVVSNLPNTSILGTYIINYDVTDNADNAATTLTRTVNVLEGSISLSSGSLDYGYVSTTSQASNTVTVTNTGTTAVEITGLSNPAAPFSISGGSCTALPLTLAAGASCEINVLFNPVDEGSFDDSLQIISNASTSPDEVTLSGTSRVVVVPTLSQWALILLSLLILGMVYRKRQHLI